MPYLGKSDHEPFFNGMSLWKKIAGIVILAILIFLSIKSII